MPKHILSVSNYEPLLRIRQLLLEQNGYSVSSAIGIRDVVAHCCRRSYDLLILGHSIPETEKDELARTFREHCAAPVLCLRRYLERGAKTAEYYVSSQTPQDLVQGIESIFVLNQMLQNVLENAIELTAADFGNIQLLDPGSASLTIVAQRGFGQAFLEFFSRVKTEGSACGEAMRSGRRVISHDVATDLIYTERARNVMLGARAHACQSTPILTTSGQLLGVVSTHYKSKTRPAEAKLKQLDRLVETAADCVRGHVEALKPWPIPG